MSDSYDDLRADPLLEAEPILDDRGITRESVRYDCTLEFYDELIKRESSAVQSMGLRR